MTTVDDGKSKVIGVCIRQNYWYASMEFELFVKSFCPTMPKIVLKGPFFVKTHLKWNFDFIDRCNYVVFCL